MSCNDFILKAFKDGLMNKSMRGSANISIRLPRSITFEKVGNTIEMGLSKKAIAKEKNGDHFINMQDNSACFEGWAVAIKAYCLEKNEKLVLKINHSKPQEKIDFSLDSGIDNGHFGRFLYRAIRFSQQYDWFELSEELRAVCKEFEQKYLLDSKIKLINNIPNQNAGDKGGESHIEKLLSEDYCLNNILGVAQVEKYRPFRQLPVGLFKNCVSNANNVFTGGKSAIDLWLFDASLKVLNIVELKFDNKMIGIITEIFFYSNYIYDMILRDDCRFFLNDTDEIKGDDRGYQSLLNIDKNRLCAVVRGVMLNDKMTGYHPLVNKDTMDVLNANNMNGRLIYDKVDYDAKITIEKVLPVK